MKPESSESAYQQIVSHIENNGNQPSEWYAGVTANWENRLFNDHTVPKTGHGRIARQCFTSKDARAAEEALLQLGCDGAPGGGDETAVFVYAYRKVVGVTSP